MCKNSGEPACVNRDWESGRGEIRQNVKMLTSALLLACVILHRYRFSLEPRFGF